MASLVNSYQPFKEGLLPILSSCRKQREQVLIHLKRPSLLPAKPKALNRIEISISYENRCKNS